MIEIVRRAVLPIGLCISLAVFFVGNYALQRIQGQRVSLEMQVSMPWFVQVVMSGGDRYLAANVAAIRALVASTEKLDADGFKVLARVHEDVAFLNPAHEDNYYLATAILPWEGEVEATQRILMHAMKGRPFDELPPYYYAFNLYYFQKNPNEGARWLLTAAERSQDVGNRMALQDMAVRWFERGNEPSAAVGIVEAMAKSVKQSAFRNYLMKRVERLKELERLKQAAARFERETGRRVKSLNDLVERGDVASLPVDPLGLGFDVDERGVPVLLSRRRMGEVK